MTHADGDTYTWQPMPNKTWKDLVPLIVPFGPTTATYTNDGNGANFIVNNQCRPLCPWTVVDGNGKVLAKATKAGACTNGPMFCCCPLLLMSGQAKTFMILDGQGAEVLTMQQSLYPCWSVISCEGVALFLGAVADCKEFVSGSVMKTIRQPVYGPLAGLSAKSEQYGVMEVTYVNKPQSVCTAAAFTQVKCEFIPREGFVPTPDQKAALGLLIMLYKGQTIKDCLTFPGVLFPVPKGNDLADRGLGSSYQYHKLEEVKLHFVKEFKHVVDSNQSVVERLNNGTDQTRATVASKGQDPTLVMRCESLMKRCESLEVEMARMKGREAVLLESLKESGGVESREYV
eukprot:GHVU01101440.1.p1 GENE.GHVU01101440.1~~GHVU01101440.1.p1  ORF type:complete len:358 (+),score=40.18 GHVU01101440.1:43-1074(+)